MPSSTFKPAATANSTRGDADADDDDIRGLDVAVAQDDVLDRVGATQLGGTGSQPQLHAVVGVQLTEHLADLVT